MRRESRTAYWRRLKEQRFAGLARRMPARVNSDHLSLLGLVAMFLAGIFLRRQWTQSAAAAPREPLHFSQLVWR